MSVVKYFLVIVFLVQMDQTIMAQEILFEKDSISKEGLKNLDIYLVIGQSNMSGRAKIEEESSSIIENSYLFTGDNRYPWVHANNPLNRYSTTRKKISMQRLSPAYSFTKTMTRLNPGHEIGLVMNAKGGTKIVQWLPGTELYEEAIAQTHKALEFGTIKGVIWHQGEGDTDSIRKELYLGRIEILINALREEFKSSTLPFVAGQVFDNEKRKEFNAMLLNLPDFINYTGVVSSKGVTTFDGTHFDSKSALMMGERYAAAMKRIQGKLKK